MVKHTYRENDFPLQLPVEGFGHVAMTQQGSSRLHLNFSDAIAQDEWAAMLEGVKGYGRLRLGPERRMVRPRLLLESIAIISVTY